MVHLRVMCTPPFGTKMYLWEGFYVRMVFSQRWLLLGRVMSFRVVDLLFAAMSPDDENYWDTKKFGLELRSPREFCEPSLPCTPSHMNSSMCTNGSRMLLFAANLQQYTKAERAMSTKDVHGPPTAED